MSAVFDRSLPLWLILILCCSLPVTAQDYLVTQKNDTLRGKAKIMPYDVIDRISINDGIVKKQFTAVQAKFLMLQNEPYGPVRTEAGYRMMKLIKAGYISRYVGRGQNTLTYDVDYLVKQDGRTLEVPNVTFRKGILDFLKDCNDIEVQIDKEKLGKKNLDRIIEIYSLCIDRQTRSSRGTPAVDEADPKLVALTNLRSKLELGNLSSKTDAMDVVNDMLDKVRKRQTVPKYLVESLKGLLKDAPDYQVELDKVVAVISPQ